MMALASRSTLFYGTLSDARIVVLPYSPYFETRVAGDFRSLHLFDSWSG